MFVIDVEAHWELRERNLSTQGLGEHHRLT